MAMSRDRGTRASRRRSGLWRGLRSHGRSDPDLIMIDANQEHGILAGAPALNCPPPKLPVGAMVRIFPNMLALPAPT